MEFILLALIVFLLIFGFAAHGLHALVALVFLGLFIYGICNICTSSRLSFGWKAVLAVGSFFLSPIAVAIGLFSLVCRRNVLS